MTTQELKDFLFKQTCTIIAGRLAEGDATPPKQYISDHFEGIYQSLENEYRKHCEKKRTLIKDTL
ncbi:TPA: hypothetical protein PXM35_001300 [Yersinia enterocolitica]|nr:hypothetical protein [Yersinia enterocolitica]HDL7502555.1 hypothetical protein [Yersinia enterocolitica]